MPVDIKLDFTEFNRGALLFRKSEWGDEPASEWMDLPVTKATLEFGANQIPQVTTTFLVMEAEVAANLAELVDSDAITTYCLYCRERLVRGRWTDKEGNFVGVWTCGCVPEE